MENVFALCNTPNKATVLTPTTFARTPAQVLLLGGSKSPAYLKTSLQGLASVLPRVQRAELAGCDHLAPDNSGHPEQVVRELRPFFANGASPRP